MKKIISVKIIIVLSVSVFIFGSCKNNTGNSTNSNEQVKKFEPTPASLKNYKVPQWYKDAKFGIYFHWAPFSVPAYVSEWYPHWMYYPLDKKGKVAKIGKKVHEYHVKTWGPLDKFGYKDFIPMFTASKWNPDAWVKLFKEAGAKYLVSAAVHHDGFALWDSKYIKYNSVRMGPKRDIVNEFTSAARKEGLKTGVATHYGRHWRYYYFRPEYDNWDPKYEGLYGHRRGDNDPPRVEDEQQWENVMTELIDKYNPDYIYVDGGIGDGERLFHKPYFRQQFYNVLAHYYNSAIRHKKEVVLTYKRKFLDPDEAVEDFERSGLDSIRLSSKWQTDDKIAKQGWCYVKGSGFWPARYLIDELVDVVSKNGNFLLSIGPKPDGTLREEEVTTLKEIGKWLHLNGEAIYGTVPWRNYGKGSVKKVKGGNYFIDPDGVRFTVKNNILYAICFGWPESGTFTITSLNSLHPVSKKGIRSVSMIGSPEKLHWKVTESGLHVVFPQKKPCNFAYVLKIVPAGELLY